MLKQASFQIITNGELTGNQVIDAIEAVSQKKLHEFIIPHLALKREFFQEAGLKGEKIHTARAKFLDATLRVYTAVEPMLPNDTCLGVSYTQTNDPSLSTFGWGESADRISIKTKGCVMWIEISGNGKYPVRVEGKRDDVVTKSWRLRLVATMKKGPKTLEGGVVSDD